MVMDFEAVKSFLPHRDPFLFIDYVEGISFDGKDLELHTFQDFKETLGVEVTAHYKTKADHPIFAGHFPGRPILPGVVQVEMMAQASGFQLALLESKKNQEVDVALVMIKEAKFRKPLTPGMDLVIKTKCLRIRGNMTTNDCQIFHDNNLVAEAQVVSSFKS